PSTGRFFGHVFVLLHDDSTSGEGRSADRASTSTAPLLRSRPGCFIAPGLACGTAFLPMTCPEFSFRSAIGRSPVRIYIEKFLSSAHVEREVTAQDSDICGKIS